jgi:ribosomal protein L7/L12
MGNLIQCPMCEREISPNAISCPHCGEPMKKDANLSSMDFCNIVMISGGTEKIKVIKHLRVVTGCGLKEGLDCVDNTPSIIVKNIHHSKAEGIKASFESLGAKIELAPLNKSLNYFMDEQELEITIRCPICNSVSIKKISISKPGQWRIFRFFSLSNSQIIKECRQCGHKW